MSLPHNHQMHHDDHEYDDIIGMNYYIGLAGTCSGFFGIILRWQAPDRQP